MIIGKVPEQSNKLPERPKKTHHNLGEIFQMYLNTAIKEYEDERALGRGNRVQKATREVG